MYIYRIVGLIVACQIPALCICSDGLVTLADDGQLQQQQQHQQLQHQTRPQLLPQHDQDAPLQQQMQNNHQNQTLRASEQHQLYSDNQTIKSSPDELTLVNPHQQQETKDETINRFDLKTFRLEFNKYKILSHLGITADPTELNPQLGDELRTQLTAATLFNNANFDTGSSNSGARHKRSLSCDQVNGNKSTCCLENFYVNFTTIGWDKWILYPAGYNANYCRGQCDLSHARYYHSTLLSKYNNFVSLCCSPRQVAPLRLLYIDEDNKVHQKSIPDMIVESCDCA